MRSLRGFSFWLVSSDWGKQSVSERRIETNWDEATFTQFESKQKNPQWNETQRAEIFQKHGPVHTHFAVTQRSGSFKLQSPQAVVRLSWKSKSSGLKAIRTETLSWIVQNCKTVVDDNFQDWGSFPSRRDVDDFQVLHVIAINSFKLFKNNCRGKSQRSATNPRTRKSQQTSWHLLHCCPS